MRMKSVEKWGKYQKLQIQSNFLPECESKRVWKHQWGRKCLSYISEMVYHCSSLPSSNSIDEWWSWFFLSTLYASQLQAENAIKKNEHIIYTCIYIYMNAYVYMSMLISQAMRALAHKHILSYHLEYTSSFFSFSSFILFIPKRIHLPRELLMCKEEQKRSQVSVEQRQQNLGRTERRETLIPIVVGMHTFQHILNIYYTYMYCIWYIQRHSK